MAQSQGLTIGRVARAGGVGVETIRFHLRRGSAGHNARRRIPALRYRGASDRVDLEQIGDLLELDRVPANRRWSKVNVISSLRDLR